MMNNYNFKLDLDNWIQVEYAQYWVEPSTNEIVYYLREKE